MNLLRILATVSSLTMVSRVLGYVRDFFIAVRTSVRRLMLWARSPIAWWARLRADLILAMNSVS